MFEGFRHLGFWGFGGFGGFGVLRFWGFWGLRLRVQHVLSSGFKVCSLRVKASSGTRPFCRLVQDRGPCTPIAQFWMNLNTGKSENLLQVRDDKAALTWFLFAGRKGQDQPRPHLESSIGDNPDCFHRSPTSQEEACNELEPIPIVKPQCQKNCTSAHGLTDEQVPQNRRSCLRL